MKWKSIKHLQAEAFKRLVGVNRETFEKMVSESKQSTRVSKHKVPGKKRGPKPTISIRDQVLMLLMYYREYRTFFHTASSYGISESQCWKIITGLEQTLIKSQLFHLPGKKKLTADNKQWEVVVIDVSEHSVERPKKNSDNTIQGKRRNIL
jgi:hypothetical protein